VLSLYLHRDSRLGWPKVSGINLHVLMPIQVDSCESKLDEFADRMGLTGADHVVVRLFLLKHQPHGADIIGCITQSRRASKLPKKSFC